MAAVVNGGGWRWWQYAVETAYRSGDDATTGGGKHDKQAGERGNSSVGEQGGRGHGEGSTHKRCSAPVGSGSNKKEEATNTKAGRGEREEQAAEEGHAGSLVEKVHMGWGAQATLVAAYYVWLSRVKIPLRVTL